jgi:hypothetical protein
MVLQELCFQKREKFFPYDSEPDEVTFILYLQWAAKLLIIDTREHSRVAASEGTKWKLLIP